MKETASIVILGGGVGGASIAYHLAALGWSEVLLLERSQLTSGSTFHSAGLVGQLRSSVTLTKMMTYGVDLYRRLAAETGEDPGWREVGSLRLASSRPRLEELARQAGWAQTFGLPLHMVSTSEALELWDGLFDPTGVLGAVFLPTDGSVNPFGLAMALAAGARRGGGEIRTNTRAVGIGVEQGKITHVDTDAGRVMTELVVLAGGVYSLQLGRMAGINIPVVPMAHQYAHTRIRRDVPRHLPTMRDPDRLVYFREEVGGLLMGGYERDPLHWHLDGEIPTDFNNKLLPPDWERFLPLTANATSLVPALAEAEVTQLINGPEAFTPDGEFILGESEVGGLFVATGFCAHGIAGAGGVGKVMAEWIDSREPTMDLWKMDIRRFGGHYRSRSFCLKRTEEIYSTYYDIVYPYHERKAGRPLRTSPAYAQHLALSAEFGEKSGWERVNWYRSNEDPGHEHFRPRGWAGENWSTAIVTEHLATRTDAALFDESSFAKIDVEGPLAFLQELCANDLDRPVGTVIYTAMLNRAGGIECDVTVTRLAAERWLIVTGTALGRHDLSWIRKWAPEAVSVRDVTGSLACFGLWGPAARRILSEICEDDLAFSFMQARQLIVGDVPCTALRVTYVGELGWELYAPVEYGAHLWDLLIAAGQNHGLVPGGYRAIDSLRLEKGYRVWGSDITSETDPYSSGLGFAVRAGKPSFHGKPALAAIPGEGGGQRLVCLVLSDSRSVALGNEPVKRDVQVVGRVSSGGLGYYLEASIAYAWIPASLADPGTSLAVEVFGVEVPAEVRTDPLFDPTGRRIKG